MRLPPRTRNLGRHDRLHVGISADEPPNAFSTTFDGIASTVERARAAAAGKDVHVAGGAATVQRALNAGLVDALQLHPASVPLGARVPLFRGAGR
jgi:dihydrofolate reductase